MPAAGLVMAAPQPFLGSLNQSIFGEYALGMITLNEKNGD